MFSFSLSSDLSSCLYWVQVVAGFRTTNDTSRRIKKQHRVTPSTTVVQVVHGVPHTRPGSEFIPST